MIRDVPSVDGTGRAIKILLSEPFVGPCRRDVPGFGYVPKLIFEYVPLFRDNEDVM